MSRRAEMVANTLNTIEGFHCNPVQGAMYAFPKVGVLDPGVGCPGQ
jgi:alanine transaminase